MQNLDMTKMSARGQVVIPGDIRHAMGLAAGTKFVVAGEGDTVILKRIGRPSVAEIDKLFKETERAARKAGMTRSYVKNTIEKVRSGR